jgi:hypothetical protein
MVLVRTVELAEHTIKIVVTSEGNYQNAIVKNRVMAFRNKWAKDGRQRYVCEIQTG